MAWHRCRGYRIHVSQKRRLAVAVSLFCSSGFEAESFFGLFTCCRPVTLGEFFLGDQPETVPYLAVLRRNCIQPLWQLQKFFRIVSIPIFTVLPLISVLCFRKCSLHACLPSCELSCFRYRNNNNNNSNNNKTHQITKWKLTFCNLVLRYT
jgi:hypothetical protein